MSATTNTITVSLGNYNPISNNFSGSYSWNGSAALGGVTSVETWLIIRDKNTWDSSNWLLGIFEGNRMRTYTVAETAHEVNGTFTMTKSQVRTYLEGGTAYVFYVEAIGKDGSGTIIQKQWRPDNNGIGHDEDRDPGANATNTFSKIITPLNIDVRPIPEIPVLTGSTNICGNQLEWNETDDTDGYYVYRDFVLIATITGSTNTSFLDESPDSGVTYAYEVHSYNSVWTEGEASNLLFLTLTDDYAKGPEIDSFTADECPLTNTLSISLPAEDYVVCAEYFNIYRRTYSPVLGTYELIGTIDATTGTTEFVDETTIDAAEPNLIYNTQYQYRITQGSDSQGGWETNGKESIWTGITYDFQIELVGNDCPLEVEITANANGFPACPETFKIYRSTHPTTGFTEIVEQPFAINYTDTGITEYNITYYYYSVVSNSEYGGWTLTSDTESMLIPFNTPEFTTEGDSCDKTITLTWGAAATCTGDYKVYRSDTIDGTYDLIATLPSGSTGYEDSSGAIQIRTSYYYKVGLFTTTGHEVTTAPVEGIIEFAAPTLSVGTKTADAIKLNWVANESCNDGYIIQRRLNSSGGAYTTIATVDTSILTYEDSNILVNTLYDYRVIAIAINDWGLSDYSNVVTTQYEFFAPVLVVDDYGLTSVDLSYTTSNAPTSVLGYSVERKIDEGSFVVIGTSSSGTFSDSDVIYNVPMTYRVRAIAQDDNGFSPYSNEETVLIVVLNPADYTFEELFDITTPSSCSASDGSLIIKNDQFNTSFDFELYKDGELIESSDDAVFTGLTNGIYYVKFVSESIFFSDYTTEYYVMTTSMTGVDVTVSSYNNIPNHIIARTGGKINVTTDPSGVTVTVYDQDLNVLDTGTTSYSLAGLCGGYFYIKVTSGSCNAYFLKSIRNDGLFQISGIKRVLYNTNPSDYKINFDSNINYIENILLAGTGSTSITSWKEFKDFNEATSKLEQTITQNGSTKEFTQTLSLQIGQHFNYSDAYSEFLKPQNREFVFLIQDTNDNWWYVGETTKAQLTRMELGQGSEVSFFMEFNSFQKSQLKQVDPDYIDTITLSSTVDKYCGYSQTGIKKLWIGDDGGDSVTYNISISGGQYTINHLTGITFTQYVVNSSASSFGIVMEKDGNGQNYRVSVNAGWHYIGDPNMSGDGYEEEDAIDYLLNNEVYVMVQDVNDIIWFFGKNSRLKLVEFTKATGDDNGYTVSFEGIDNNIWFGGDELI